MMNKNKKISKKKEVKAVEQKRGELDTLLKKYFVNLLRSFNGEIFTKAHRTQAVINLRYPLMRLHRK